LIITGGEFFFISDKRLAIEELFVYKLLKKYINITTQILDNSFFVKIDQKLYITPLLVSLMLVETMDIVFAVDSIPAIFAITKDPYIVYTSNIFAILGLRSLYFCLVNIIERFKYVKYSLAVVL